METRLEVLSPDEQAQVHERTLRVLGECGMRVDTDEGRRLLKAAGAQVDEGTRIVRFPRSLIEEALAACPRQFSLGGRREGWSFPLNAGRFTLLADGGATMVLDRHSGERRPPNGDDWREATILLDAFDDVGLYWSMCQHPSDIERPDGMVAYLTDLFATFGKHVQDSFGDPELAPWLLEVLDIVFGGRDEVRRRNPFSFLITPASPLIIEADYTGTWLALRDWMMPVAIMPMPLMGATAPGSRLGTVLTANCETIGTLTLVQTAAPGTPVIYAPVLATMDPRSGRYAAGAIEQAVMSAAGIAMARFYGLPVEASGSSSETYEPGIQAAYEKMALALGVTLAWPDILVGPGQLGGAVLLSFEQLLIDIEMFRIARQAHTGLPVDGERWLDDVLCAAGPGGSFLQAPSTRRNVRGGEWRLTDFGVHDTYESWRAAGSPTVIDEARTRIDQMLADHRPQGYDDDMAAALEALRRKAAAGV